MKQTVMMIGYRMDETKTAKGKDDRLLKDGAYLLDKLPNGKNFLVEYSKFFER